MKTFIRRPGNKSSHLKFITPNIPEFTGKFIEPFLGTGAVFLSLLPRKAILNDINTDISGIFSLVKNNPEYLISEINSFKQKFLILDNKQKLILCKEILAKMETFTKKKRIVIEK